MSPEAKVQRDRRNSSQDEEKRAAEDVVDVRRDGSVSLKGEDILALQDLDPALNMKMHLVNNVCRKSLSVSGWLKQLTMIPQAIDEIGWTPYHWKLFVLNGFG
jgi:hypothetical protein